MASKTLINFARQTTIHGLPDLILSCTRRKRSRLVWCFIMTLCLIAFIWGASTALMYYLDKPVAYSISLGTRARLPELYFSPQGVVGSNDLIRSLNLTEDTLVFLAGFLPDSVISSSEQELTARYFSPTFNYSREQEKVTAVLNQQKITLPQLIERLTRSIFAAGNISEATLVNSPDHCSLEVYKLQPVFFSNLTVVWLRSFAENLPGILGKAYTQGIIAYGDPDLSPLSAKDFVTFQYGWETRLSFEQVVTPGWSREDCTTPSEQHVMLANQLAGCMLDIGVNDQNCSCLPIQLAKRDQPRPLSTYCNTRDGNTRWFSMNGVSLRSSCLDSLSSVCDDRFAGAQESMKPCHTTTYSVSSTTYKMFSGRVGGKTLRSRGTKIYFSLPTHRRAIVMEEQPLYSVQKLLSQVGGVLSLLFGASLISIAQLIYHVVKTVACSGPKDAEDDEDQEIPETSEWNRPTDSKHRTLLRKTSNV